MSLSYAPPDRQISSCTAAGTVTRRIAAHDLRFALHVIQCNYWAFESNFLGFQSRMLALNGKVSNLGHPHASSSRGLSFGGLYSTTTISTRSCTEQLVKTV